MIHLTEEQLATHVDGPRSGPTFDAAARHLESCESCRARLAERVALDADLARALAHDPGEAYFAAFADRVSERIAAAAPPRAAAEAPAPRRGWLAWWNSPHRLALAGGALALAAVAALAVVVSRDGGLRSIGEQVQSPVATGAGAPRAEAPAAAEEVGGASTDAAGPSAERQSVGAPTADDVPALTAPESRRATGPAVHARQEPPTTTNESARILEREAGRPAAGKARTAAPLVAPRRAMQVKVLPNGESVPVPAAGQPVPKQPSRAAQTTSGWERPGATPLSSEASQQRDAAASAPEPAAVQPQLPPAPAAKAGRAQDALATSPTRTKDLAAPLQGAGKSLAAGAGATSAAPAPARSLPSASTRPLEPQAAPAPAAGGVAGAREEGARDDASAHRICGIVRDPSGRPVAGAVLSAAETGASATAGADGSFCLDLPGPRATLEVFAVGFLPYRNVVTAGGATASIALKPVETLAARPSWGKGAQGFRNFDAAPRPDSPASTPADVARAASEAAKRGGTVELWQRAAEAWTEVAVQAGPASPGQASARFHVAEARMNAWQIGRTPMERAAARSAVDAYLAITRDPVARALAQGWKRQLER